MTERASRRAVLAALGGGALAGCSGAGDGPTDADATGTPQTSPSPESPTSLDAEWPVPAHDAGLSNSTAAPGPTERPAELWSVSVGTDLSAPVVAGERAVVADGDGVVLAFDALTGDRLWERSVDATGAPWAVEGRVYVPTEDGIVALAVGDGSDRWERETPERAAALVTAHGVYWLAGGTESAVVALSPSGERRWRTPLAECPWRAHLFAGPSSVFVSTDHNARVPWTLAVEGGAITAEPSGCGADFEDERFHRDGTVYAVGSFPSVLEASSADGGWSESLPAGQRAISGGRERVYAAVRGGETPGLYAFAAADGSQEWNVTGEAVTGRPVVAGESLLVRVDGELRCHDPADGTELWTRPVATVGERLAVVDDLLYAADDGTVRALRPP